MDMQLCIWYLTSIITKCDRYYKVRQVLQSATLLQSVTVQELQHQLLLKLLDENSRAVSLGVHKVYNLHYG